MVKWRRIKCVSYIYIYGVRGGVRVGDVNWRVKGMF